MIENLGKVYEGDTFRKLNKKNHYDGKSWHAEGTQLLAHKTAFLFQSLLLHHNFYT